MESRIFFACFFGRKDSRCRISITASILCTWNKSSRPVPPSPLSRWYTLVLWTWILCITSGEHALSVIFARWFPRNTLCPHLKNILLNRNSTLIYLTHSRPIYNFYSHPKRHFAQSALLRRRWDKIVPFHNGSVCAQTIRSNITQRGVTGVVPNLVFNLYWISSMEEKKCKKWFSRCNGVCRPIRWEITILPVEIIMVSWFVRC